MAEKVLIVSGGSVDNLLLSKIYKCFAPDYVIAADKGVLSLIDTDINIDLVIGDFDSLSQTVGEDEALIIVDSDKMSEKVKKLNPMKDFTDTEAAISEAIKLSPKKVLIVGATGTRLDHTIANISLLKKMCDAGVFGTIIDSHNIIELHKAGDGEVLILNCDDYGWANEKHTYVSLLPLGDKVSGLSIKGLKYEAENLMICQGQSLTVSNEMACDRAAVSFETGYLIVMKTRD